MKGLHRPNDENLLVGFEGSDDAYVYKINDSVAMIGTVDFFTPIVDDPFLFGQIAAANSLSDVYAMGGEPKMAMNLLAVPDCLEPAVVAEILRGGESKADEAGCSIAGGHTVRDPEPKYGLSVTGFVHPEKIWRNTGAKAGDALILTKPLGTGVLSTALKAGMLTKESEEALGLSMAALNKTGAAIAKRFSVHACTDVTGFGLMGHAYEMVADGAVSLEIVSDRLPLLPETESLAGMGILPAGVYRNEQYLHDKYAAAGTVRQALADIAFDPQTSGGLLIAVPGAEAEECLAALKEKLPCAAVIGRFTEKKEKEIYLS